MYGHFVVAGMGNWCGLRSAMLREMEGERGGKLVFVEGKSGSEIGCVWWVSMWGFVGCVGKWG